MTLCINQSGTWRLVRSQRANQAGTWRSVRVGCINQAGTWRRFNPSLGYCFEGGYVICISGNTYWIVSPSSADVCTSWNTQNIAVTCAQTVTGCGGWFIPSRQQLSSPGYSCRVYWDTYQSTIYVSSTSTGSAYSGFCYFGVNMSNGTGQQISPTTAYRGRAFRTVTFN